MSVRCYGRWKYAHKIDDSGTPVKTVQIAERGMGSDPQYLQENGCVYDLRKCKPTLNALNNWR